MKIATQEDVKKEYEKGLGTYFKEVCVPQIQVSRQFVESFYRVKNPEGSILHFCDRRCTYEITDHIRLKEENTEIDYEWLRSFVQFEKRRPIINPIIVGYLVRGVLFTVEKKTRGPIPNDSSDVLIHKDGTWEKCLLTLPEDDIVNPYIDSLAKNVLEGFKAEAKEFWENDFCSIHEWQKVNSSPEWTITKKENL